MTTNKTIINCETNEVITREMTNAELAAEVKIQEQLASDAAFAESTKGTAKAALLERLGITAEEAALLLG